MIVATGPFQQPNIPDFSKHLSGEVLQLHSSEYKNSSQLIRGTTVIVGGGNSGAQIAVELSHESEVFLSVSHRMTFLPQDIGNKSIFWCFDKLGIYKANVNSKMGQFIKNKPDPIFGFELKSQLRNGNVILKPRVVSTDEKNLFFDDGSSVVVSNVIWSTGFKSDYRWIDLPSVVDEKGAPNHQRGVTPVKGLYFLGLPWQSCRGSALLQGVGTDAEYIFQQL